MNREATIKITGVHGRGEDKQSVVSECSGAVFEKNGKHYIKYSETDADSGEVRNSLIRIEGRHVSVEHRGNTDAKMIFEIGQTTRTTYITPMGSMLLEINTHGIDFDLRENSLRLVIDYSMGYGDNKKTPAKIIVEVL